MQGTGSLGTATPGTAQQMSWGLESSSHRTAVETGPAADQRLQMATLSISEMRARVNMLLPGRSTPGMTFTSRALDGLL